VIGNSHVPAPQKENKNVDDVALHTLYAITAWVDEDVGKRGGALAHHLSEGKVKSW
jgi:hypothetical protein